MCTRIKALLATQGLEAGADRRTRTGAERVGELQVLGRLGAWGGWLQRDLVLEGERLAVVAEQLAAL